MLLPGGVVGVLDCGMVGRLDEELTEGLDHMRMAISADLGEVILRLGSAPHPVARDSLRADLTDSVADYAGQSIQDLNLSGALTNLFETIRRYNITLPPALTLVLRTLAELEGTAQELSPEFSLAEVIRPFYARMVFRRLSVRRMLGRLQHAFSDWERLVEALPRDLSDVLRRMREGGLWRCWLSVGGLSQLASAARHQKDRRYRFDQIATAATGSVTARSSSSDSRDDGTPRPGSGLD